MKLIGTSTTPALQRYSARLPRVIVAATLLILSQARWPASAEGGIDAAAGSAPTAFDSVECKRLMRPLLAAASRSFTTISDANLAKIAPALEIAAVHRAMGDQRGGVVLLRLARRFAERVTRGGQVGSDTPAMVGGASSEALESVAVAQAEAGDWDGANMTAGEIRDSDLRYRSFTAIVNAERESGDISDARVTIEAAKAGIGADADEYDRAIQLAGIALIEFRLGDRDAAQATIDEARRIATRLPAQDRRTMGLVTLPGPTRVVINTEVQIGDRAAVAALIKRVTEPMSLCEIADLQSSAGDRRGARQTIAAALAAATLRGGNSDAPAVTAKLAESQAKAGDLSGAKRTVRELKVKIVGLSQPAMNTALESLFEAECRTGDIAGARETAEQIYSAAFASAGADATVAKATLTQAAASLGDRLYTLATAQVKSGDWAGARETANAIDVAERKSGAFQTLGVAQARAGRLDAARSTVALIPLPTYADTLREVIAVSEASSGNLDGAKEAVNSIINPEIRAITFKSIAGVRARARDASGAKAAFAESERIYIDDIPEAERRAYGMAWLGRDQFMAGDLAGARKTLMEARAAAMGIAEKYSRNEVLSRIASHQGYCLDVDEARRTAVAADLPYSQAISFGAAAGAQVRLGDPAGAKKTIDAAIQSADRIDDVGLRIQALTQVATEIANCERIKRASAPASTPAICGPGNSEPASTPAVLPPKSRAPSASDLLPVALDSIHNAEMRAEQGLDGSERDDALFVIVLAYTRVGRIPEGLRVASTIKTRNHMASAYRVIAVRQTQSGDLAGARQTALTTDSVVLKSSIYLSLARAEGRLGDWAAARADVDSATVRDSTRSSWNQAADVEGLRLAAFAGIQAECGQMSAALQTATSISNLNSRLAALQMIGAAAAKVNHLTILRLTCDAEEATLAAHRATKADLSPETAWETALATIARELSVAGDKARAAATFADARRLCIEADDRGNVFVVVRAQAESGDFDGAKRTVEDIRQAGLYIQEMYGIATEQMKVGDFAGAKETLEAARASVEVPTRPFKVGEWLGPAAQRAQLLSDISSTESALGDRAAAMKTADEAESAAREIPGGGSGSEVLYAIARARAEAGDFAGAQRTADAQAIDGDYDRIQSLLMIANFQMWAGDESAAKATLNCARTIAQDTSDPLRKVQRLLEVASSYGQVWDGATERDIVAQAKKFANGITDTRIKAGAEEALQRSGPRTPDLNGSILTAEGTGLNRFQLDIHSRQFADDGLKYLALNRLAAHDPQGARVAASQIGDIVVRVGVLDTIASAQVESGDRNGARSTLAVARKGANGTGNVWERIDSLESLAATEMHNGDSSDADSDFASASRAALGIKDTGGKAQALYSIVHAEADAGELALASRMSGAILVPELWLEAQIAVASGQMRTGHLNDARTTLTRVENSARLLGGVRISAQVLCDIAVAIGKAASEKSDRVAIVNGIRPCVSAGETRYNLGTVDLRQGDLGMPVDDNLKKKIDSWIRKAGRNEYGDPKDTVYAGGNPLFDERSPKLKDKYDYILEKNPDLKEK